MDAEDAGRICVSPAPHHSFQLGPKQKVIAPPTVTRLHRYEWNSNWPRNVQWANGSAMRPDRPAQCLVCQGEGLCGLHLEGLCVCDGGETKSRQVRREFKFQRLRWICCSDKFELASSASRRLRRLCPPRSRVFSGKARGESDPLSAQGMWHVTFRFCFSVRCTGSRWHLLDYLTGFLPGLPPICATCVHWFYLCRYANVNIFTFMIERAVKFNVYLQKCFCSKKKK